MAANQHIAAIVLCIKAINLSFLVLLIGEVVLLKIGIIYNII